LNKHPTYATIIINILSGKKKAYENRVQFYAPVAGGRV
jgi:hypothetical protein